MTDTEEAQLKADGQVTQVQGPSLSVSECSCPGRGPPADNQYIEGGMLVVRFPDEGES